MKTDARVGSIEVKIKKLDGELGRYKEQMSKLRNGPGKVSLLLPCFGSGRCADRLCCPCSLLRPPDNYCRISSPLPRFHGECIPQAAIQQRAMRTLQQKKMYENQLAQLTQQTFNMESAALATENLRNTMATVDAMKTANKELRKQYGKIDVDKIEVCVLSLLSSFVCGMDGYSLFGGLYTDACLIIGLLEYAIRARGSSGAG